MPYIPHYLPDGFLMVWLKEVLVKVVGCPPVRWRVWVAQCAHTCPYGAVKALSISDPHVKMSPRGESRTRSSES